MTNNNEWEDITIDDIVVEVEEEQKEKIVFCGDDTVDKIPFDWDLLKKEMEPPKKDYSYDKNRLCWSDHHMMLALVTAQRSPDPNTKVGACIVDKQNKILSLGYNGVGRGIDPADIPWDRQNQDPAKTKYPFIIHAEANAVLNADANLEGGIIYVTLFPCNECMKIIIQKGIKTIHYLEDKYADTWQVKTSKKMAHHAKVAYFKHNFDKNSFNIAESFVKLICKR